MYHEFDNYPFDNIIPSMSSLENANTLELGDQNSNASVSSDSFEELNTSSLSQNQNTDSDFLNQQINTENSTQTIETYPHCHQSIQTDPSQFLPLLQLQAKLNKSQSEVNKYKKVIEGLEKEIKMGKQRQNTLRQENKEAKERLRVMQKEFSRSVDDGREFVQKISCLQQSLEFQRDSYEENIKTYKSLLQQSIGAPITKGDPQKLRKYIQIKNERIKQLVKIVDKISSKASQNKHGKIPSTKIDLDEQIQKLWKIHEYCSKLESKTTALKQNVLKLQRSLEENTKKSIDNRGIVEKILQPLFYKHETPNQSRQPENKK